MMKLDYQENVSFCKLKVKTKYINEYNLKNRTNLDSRDAKFSKIRQILIEPFLKRQSGSITEESLTTQMTWYPNQPMDCSRSMYL